MQLQLDELEQEELYACDIAMREIPASEIASDEANDYVLHYFGAECYEQWRNQAKQTDD